MSQLKVPLPDGTHRFRYHDIPCWEQILELRLATWQAEGSIIPSLRTASDWAADYDRTATHWLEVRDGFLVGAANHSIWLHSDRGPDSDNYRRAGIPSFAYPFASINRLVVEPQWQRKLRKDNPGFLLPKTITNTITQSGYPELIMVVCSEPSKRIAEHLGFVTLGKSFANPFLEPGTEVKLCNVMAIGSGPVLKGPGSCRL